MLLTLNSMAGQKKKHRANKPKSKPKKPDNTAGDPTQPSTSQASIGTSAPPEPGDSYESEQTSDQQIAAKQVKPNEGAISIEVDPLNRGKTTSFYMSMLPATRRVDGVPAVVFRFEPSEETTSIASQRSNEYFKGLNQWLESGKEFDSTARSLDIFSETFPGKKSTKASIEAWGEALSNVFTGVNANKTALSQLEGQGVANEYSKISTLR